MTEPSTNGHAPVWSPELDWVLSALWGGCEEVEVSRPARPSPSRRAVESFGVLPNARHPRLLVPLGSSRAAARAVRDHATHRLALRAVKPLLAASVRLGLGHRLIRDRLSVSIPEGTVAEALPGLLIKEHLQKVLGRDALEMAVKFDAPRPHRKPTLQILGTDGEVLAYVKVGWNALTRQLVQTEAKALEGLMGLPSPPSFEVPRVIHADRWRSLHLLVIAPLATTPRERGASLLRTPPIGATRELAQLGATRRGALERSYWWAQVRRRLARAEAALGTRSALSDAARRLEQRYGESELSFGFWHGDWVPANMCAAKGRLSVWDWERSGPLAPVGLDAIHFEYQAALSIEGLSPTNAAERLLDGSSSSLTDIGVSETLRPALLSLHLMEMALRFEEARAAGVDTVDRKYPAPLEAMLSRPSGAARPATHTARADTSSLRAA
jgi:hypothetical protein